MQELFSLLRRVAPTDADVLIVGESGVGKELVANALHAQSARRQGPFVKINCASFPKDLIESELFGYKKGAFTGATTDRSGLLKAATGGSLLLDEIGEMPVDLQTRLLRTLQNREYRAVGSNETQPVDFRLISATNVDVEAALKDGRLREDLYFRINTITVQVPPLRDRPDDIPLLSDHFLAKYSARHGRRNVRLAPETYDALIHYRWPGNVRELEHTIERGVLVAPDG
jgi:transcriptional regulator with PAS, ATPase and Fis domain